MNRRQRMLAIAGAIVVGGAALYQFGAWAFYRPLQKLNADVQSAQSRKEHLLGLLRNQQDAISDWRSWYGRVLDERAVDAELRFREDLAQLLEKHGLREGLSLSPGAKRTATNGFIEVPFMINVVGTFEELVSFLVDFYERPYLARIRDLMVISEDTGLSAKRAAGGGETARPTAGVVRGGRGNGRPGRGSAGSPGTPPPASGADGHVEAKDARLRITMTVVTLVLPPISSMKADRRPLTELLPALRDVKPEPLPAVPEEWPTVKRLTRDSSELTGVMNTYVFTKFVPKREVVVQKPPDTQPVARVDTPPPPPPPPVRPNADKQYVIASVSLNGQPAVLVRDDSAGGTTKRVAIDEQVDDGTVILIDPTGMVVRVPQRGAPGQPPGEADGGHEDYFYPLGKSFKDRQPFEPELHAELARQLRRSGRI